MLALLRSNRSASVALGRTGAGVAMIVRPRALSSLLGVDSATSARMSWAMQMLGAREIAVGVGTLAALRDGNADATRTWIAAGLLCDAVDVLVVGAGLARRRLPVAAGASTLAVALGAVSTGWRALQTRT